MLEAFEKEVFYTPHALRQMSSPDRLILRREVEGIIVKGEVIEDYPEDVRGHSCLLFGGSASERAIHVVCAPKRDYLTVISAYLPDPKKWEDDLKIRKARA